VSSRDVLVVGGGPAGAAAAIALARGGAAVAVLARPERGDRPRVGETVAPTVVRPLARLGAWDAFRADGHVPAPGTVVCWGEDQPYENDYIFNPYGNGWHLDRGRFDATLLRAAAAAGASVHEVAPGDHVETDGATWSARVGDRLLRAPVAVDATGRAACIGQRRGAAREHADRLVGLVRFGTAASSEPRTILEATPDGWWYGAILPGDRAVTAFFTDADLLPQGAAARERHWVEGLSGTRFVTGLMAGAGRTRIHTAVARTSVLSRCAGPGWLAVGDAARTLDPLSGQGLEAALTSAIRAAEALLGPCRDRGMAEFARDTAEQHHGHLAGRLAHYRRERRWAHSPFWQRRHTGISGISMGPAASS
jgi:flavin-dependent dehydrogenase